MSLTNDRPASASPAEDIVSTRVFDAPRETVFRAFTDADVLARWWGPHGFTNAFEEFDPRPGGAWRFTMRGPDGAEYPMEKEYLEVACPERIVLHHIQRNHDFIQTMTFAEEAGGTRLTWRISFESEEDAAPVRDIMRAGNEQNFDRLAAQLAAMA